MIEEERLITYINSLDRGNPQFLAELEEEARNNYVPVIRRETQNLLKLLLAMNRPERILEVGTAVGFSALLMEYYNPAECKITTIENYGKRIPVARENFMRAGKENVIQLLEGDAGEVMKGLAGPFDFIFMDAAKGQYLSFLLDVVELLAENGTLVSDNILHEGDVLQSRYAVTRRDRTIHGRMREYLEVLAHHERLETICLPVGDGITISTKR